MRKFVKIILSVFLFVFIINISLNILGFNVMSQIHNSKQSNFLTNLGSNILGLIYIVCTAAGIIAVLYAAIKYMMSSPSEKASIKGQMIGLVIGGIILFGAPQILKIIQSTKEWW